MFLFDENELAHIRIANKEGYFYLALKQFVEDASEQDPLDKKARHFLTLLHNWRERANAQSLADTISMIYHDTGYYDFVGAMSGGVQRQANLRALIIRAQEFESTSYRGLFRFLTYIGSMRKSGDDMEAVRTLGEQENVVRIMSIHSSKGLEYPVVFVSRLSKGFNKQDTNGLILRHKELGIASKVVDRTTHTSFPTLAHMSIAAKILEETKAEEMRLFYVALTRARDHLFLLGVSKDAAAEQEKWRIAGRFAGNKLPGELVARAGSYLDWTLMSLADEDAGGHSIWQLKIVHATELKAQIVKTDTLVERLSANHVDDHAKSKEEILTSRWLWQYSLPAAQMTAAKVSVSDLKHKWDLDEDDQGQIFYYPRPQFAREKQLSPAERGSGYHTLMQHLPLKERINDDLVRTTIAQLVARELLSNLQAAAIRPGAIVRFFESGVGRRMLNSSDTVRREVPFTYGIPAPSEVGEEEVVLVQGIVDCMFEEAGEWIIIDYKTDSVVNHSIAQLTEKYGTQINTYAQAISDITGKKVKEKHLYFFEADENVDVDDFFRYDKRG
jgi:ATP-dependent helicase/nuclease subunit A